jgi:hypothetical protein
MNALQVTGCTKVLVCAAIGAALLGGGCATDPEADPATSDSEAALSKCVGCTLPTSGLYATFRVGSETFRQQITSQAGIIGALALWRGTSNARIPIGALDCKCTGWNCQWDFHMVPSSITFTEIAIEICDGTPSYVNNHCSDFARGSYCPWSAVLTSLRDCRTSPLCPTVPR